MVELVFFFSTFREKGCEGKKTGFRECVPKKNEFFMVLFCVIMDLCYLCTSF